MLASRLRRRLLGISPRETKFERRGFCWRDTRAKGHLEHIGEVFVHGLHVALENPHAAVLGSRLGEVPAELRGFAFEGAAMALALLDNLTPWRRDRVRRFLKGPGALHAYMVHVGIGWALARLGRRPDRLLGPMSPLLRWLVVDGYGFHEGYFRWPRYVARHDLHPRVSGYALRAFDQGLGRSLWFVRGADVEGVRLAISTFQPHRWGDLWSGVGLASAYAGGVEADELRALRAAAAAHASDLAQGAAFAAAARRRAGNPTTHTDLACRVMCGVSAEEAATMTEAAVGDLPPGGYEPSYEMWRQAVRTQLCCRVLA